MVTLCTIRLNTQTNYALQIYIFYGSKKKELFPSTIFNFPKEMRGTRWRSWMMHCATSRKVAGSIPNGFIGIFHWHNPSGCTMALGLNQPLTEMSTRNIPEGNRRPVPGADKLSTFICRMSWNLGASNSWNPQGLSRPEMGLLNLYLGRGNFAGVLNVTEINLTFNCGDSASIPGQSMWDLWWIKWYRARFFSKYFVFLLSVPFHRRSTFVSSIHVALTKRTKRRSLGTFQKAKLFRTSGGIG